MVDRRILLLGVALLWLSTLLWLGLAQAADSGSYSSGTLTSSTDSDVLEQARQAVDLGSFGSAISLLEDARRRDPENPDIYNLLGFSHRKLGEFDTAERYYRRALELDPEHRGANEYIGELYLQTDRPEMAQERLQVLDESCFWSCKEYDQLKARLERYRRSARGG